MGIGAAIIGAGALGAGASLIGSSQQAGAAKDASQQQMAMYQQTRGDLMPYNQAGQAAINQLMSYWGLSAPQPQAPTGMSGAMPGSGSLIGNIFGIPGGQGATNLGLVQSPVGGAPMGTQVAPGGGGAPTAGSAAGAFNALQNYPGYQFQYGQGLEAINRNLSAGGRYMSGAMLKDAQQFGQGMAQNAVHDYLGMLQYLGTTGQNAAAQTGSAGTQAAANSGQAMMSGATAQASGMTGAANALSNAAQGYAMYNAYGGGGAGAGGFGAMSPNGFGMGPGGGGVPGSWSPYGYAY